MELTSQQLTLDTVSGDISPSYVQSGRVSSPGHLRAAGKDGSGATGDDIPTNYVFDELQQVFDQLGRGDLEFSQRVELARRAKAYIEQLRGGTEKDAHNQTAAQEQAGGEASMTTEPDSMLQPFVTLAQEGDLAVLIVQEASPATNGVMKLRVPFYVSGSVAQAKGIAGKLHFGADKLDRILAEGKARIAENKQPITVYARHAHAIAMDKLPVGRVVGLERKGGIGYAIEEIAPTTEGRDVQTLARNKMLNAVSLRANPGSYTLEKILINGEEAWDVDLTLDGIDFAPDGPAQPTYGIEVLAAEARVERRADNLGKRSVSLEPTVLTLEAVKRDRPDIVQAIETPLKDANAKLTQELDTTKTALSQATEKLAKAETELAKVAREAYIQELAAKFPEPATAIVAIQEVCKDETTKDGIASKVMPLLLDALAKKTPEPKPVVEANPFLKMFPGSGNGSVLGLEALNTESQPKGETVDGLAVPA